MRRAEADDWLFALCALQTEGAYTKAGPTEFYFGSVRMSGLQGSRPCVGVMPEGGPGRRWARDVQIALRSQGAIADTFGLNDDGLKLTWSVPWSGKSTGLSIGLLDPLFIEICRLVRLTGAAPTSSLRALRRGSEVQRVAGKDMRGCLGDLWTPLDRKYSADEPTAFQIGKGGLSYSIVSEFLYPQAEARFIPCPAQKIQPSDGDAGVNILACGIARGQREYPSVSRIERFLFRHELSACYAEANLAAGSGLQGAVNAIGAMRRDILWPALTHLFDTGKSREKNEKTPGSVKDRANSFVHCSSAPRTRASSTT